MAVDSWPADVRLSDDGGHLYAASAVEDGGVLHGIWREDAEPMWETLAPGHSARCVGEVGGAVYVCGQRATEG